MTQPLNVDAESPAVSIVLNDHGAYVLWLGPEELPPKWIRIGPTRTLADAIGWLFANWPDMSPIALDVQGSTASPLPK